MATKCFDETAFKAVVDKITAGFAELVALVTSGTPGPTPGPTDPVASGPWKMAGQADLWISRGDKPGTIPTTGTDVTAVNGEATISGLTGKVTSESLTQASQGTYTLTIRNDKVALSDTFQATIVNGTNTTGSAVIASSVVSDGKVVVTIKNDHASDALNGTVVVSFTVSKATTLRRR